MFPVKYDVFVSYSRDDMERVRPLAEELRRRGYRVFFDLESIVVGERFKERLERSIRSSRTLVLCWSADAQASQFVHYEYMRAIGLKKHVFPWLLDETPLPQMVELHGITSPDAGQAAAALQKRLGWSTARRRWIAAAASALAMAVLDLVAWHGYFAQPPWRFEGEVIDRHSRMPIAGVEVDVDKYNPVYTDDRGHYLLQAPQPQPKYVHVRFRKEGYEGDEMNLSSSRAGDNDLEKLR
jgi:hypothetical protein